MTRRGTIRLACLWGLALSPTSRGAVEKDAAGGDNPPPAIVEYKVKLETVTAGFDGKTCKGIIPPGNQYGSDNSVYAARILWKMPNREWNKQ